MSEIFQIIQSMIIVGTLIIYLNIANGNGILEVGELFFLILTLVSFFILLYSLFIEHLNDENCGGNK